MRLSIPMNSNHRLTTILYRVATTITTSPLPISKKIKIQTDMSYLSKNVIKARQFHA